MTIEEAQEVANIVLTADSGCDTCVERLVVRLRKSFPQFEWIFSNTYDMTLIVLPRKKG